MTGRTSQRFSPSTPVLLVLKKFCILHCGFFCHIPRPGKFHSPFTGLAYAARTGQAAEAVSFEMIAGGALAFVLTGGLALNAASKQAGQLAATGQALM